MKSGKIIAIVMPIISLIIGVALLSNSFSNMEKTDKALQTTQDQLKSLQIINASMNNGTITPAQAHDYLSSVDYTNSSTIANDIQSQTNTQNQNKTEQPKFVLEGYNYHPAATNKLINDELHGGYCNANGFCLTDMINVYTQCQTNATEWEACHDPKLIEVLNESRYFK